MVDYLLWFIGDFANMIYIYWTSTPVIIWYVLQTCLFIMMALEDTVKAGEIFENKWTWRCLLFWPIIYPVAIVFFLLVFFIWLFLPSS